MSRPPAKLPPTLHIYRYLLREASYLPPVCQPYVHNRIKAQFARHRDESPDSPDTRRRLKDAMRSLRFLRAADSGDPESMYRVALLVFGRIGKRRRKLIAEFVKKDPPGDTAALEGEIQKQMNTAEAADPNGKRGNAARAARPEQPKLNSWSLPAPRPTPSGNPPLHPLPPDFLDKWDLPKLSVFISSQGDRNVQSPKPPIKQGRTDPSKVIPEKNIWERPLPYKLQRSKLRKWWKAMINRVMPPVPQSEWEMLRQLATGTSDPSLSKIPAWRPRGTSLVQDGQVPGRDGGQGQRSWNWEAYATEPVRSVERGRSRKFAHRMVEFGDGSRGQGAASRMRKFSPRFWRRLYSKIWDMTAAMEPRQDVDVSTVESRRDPHSWNITWGKKSIDIAVAKPSQMVFFENSPNTRPTYTKR